MLGRGRSVIGDGTGRRSDGVSCLPIRSVIRPNRATVQPLLRCCVEPVVAVRLGIADRVGAPAGVLARRRRPFWLGNDDCIGPGPAWRSEPPQEPRHRGWSPRSPRPRPRPGRPTRQCPYDGHHRRRAAPPSPPVAAPWRSPLAPRPPGGAPDRRLQPAQSAHRRSRGRVVHALSGACAAHPRGGACAVHRRSSVVPRRTASVLFTGGAASVLFTAGAASVVHRPSSIRAVHRRSSPCRRSPRRNGRWRPPPRQAMRNR